MRFLVIAAAILAFSQPANAVDLVEPPMLADDVRSGALPPIDRRIPLNPQIVQMPPSKSVGTYGGDLRILMGRPKDTRLMYVYGYSRLVAYDESFNLKPDILSEIDIEDGRIFTLRLRPGHRWSDGHPFTSADFKYWWEAIANDPDLYPAGVPRALLVNGQPPFVEFPDNNTVRYTWPSPNPRFLTLLAAPRPQFLYAPAHYLRRFHKRFADPDALANEVETNKKRDWIDLHFDKARLYRMQNPELPTLQPWRLTTQPPANRLIFERNAFYHRVDAAGQQLPYIDRVVMSMSDSKLIPAKVGAGEVDLQARYISFGNYTFLKQAAKRNDYDVRLWRRAYGSQVSLYPNLNAKDPVWRSLFRERQFRRALSLAINRHEINQVIFYGLALPVCDIALPQSPLFSEDCRNPWVAFDLDQANRMLDEMGLTQRNDRGIRLLPDGRPMEIVIESAGESTEQTDVLALISDSWREIGIRLFTKSLQRDLLRTRVFSGATLMSVWTGMDNALITPDTDPREMAPVEQSKLCWPKWGQYYETKGKSGEPVDDLAAKRLLTLYETWSQTYDAETREGIWREMLDIHKNEVFSINTVYGVFQPVAVSNRLRNVPKEGFFGWNPGAHFGVYRPDTFWFDETAGSAGSG